MEETVIHDSHADARSGDIHEVSWSFLKIFIPKNQRSFSVLNALLNFHKTCIFFYYEIGLTKSERQVEIIVREYQVEEGNLGWDWGGYENLLWGDFTEGVYMFELYNQIYCNGFVCWVFAKMWSFRFSQKQF